MRISYSLFGADEVILHYMSYYVSAITGSIFHYNRMPFKTQTPTQGRSLCRHTLSFPAKAGNTLTYLLYSKFYLKSQPRKLYGVK